MPLAVLSALSSVFKKTIETASHTLTAEPINRKDFLLLLIVCQSHSVVAILGSEAKSLARAP